MMDDALYTVEEVAARLRVNVVTVRRWLRSGRLRGVLPGGPRAGYRITAADLGRFLASRATSEAPAPSDTA